MTVPLLTRLGVPPELQAWFSINDGVFDYGDAREVFRVEGHRVPVTSNIYAAGSDMPVFLLVSSSVMEAVAFLTLHPQFSRRLELIRLAALGNLPVRAQADYLRHHFPASRFLLLNGRSLPEVVADCLLAAWLRGHPLRAHVVGNVAAFMLKDKEVRLPLNSLSRFALEQAMGLRTGIRTFKAHGASSFTELLLRRAKASAR